MATQVRFSPKKGLDGNNFTITNVADPINDQDVATKKFVFNNYLSKTNGIASGLSLNDGYTEEVFTVTGTSYQISPSNGSIQIWNLTGNSTVTTGVWNSGQSIILGIDDGTAYTITWPSIAWTTASGTAPTLSTTTITWIVLWKVGNIIYGKY